METGTAIEAGTAGREPRPPLAFRITGRQWLALDVTVAVLCALIHLLGLRLLHAPHAWVLSTPMAIVTLAATLPVAVRRIWPLPVLVIVVAAVAILTAYARAPLSGDLMLGMASYMVAVRLPRPVSVAALVGTQVAIGAGLLTAAATVHTQSVMLHSMLAAAAMWFVGDGVSQRRKYRAGVEELQRRRRAEEAARGRRAIAEERLRIARELHDVLAHTLSMVTVQAGVGRRVGASHPAEALNALRTVEESSRGALDELRRILCLIRGDDEAAPPAPEQAALPGTTLPDTDLDGTDLPGTALDGTDLPGTDLDGTALDGTDLPGSALGGSAGATLGGNAGVSLTGDAQARAALAPAPSLADLDALAAMVRSAGTPVTLRLTGDAAEVFPSAGLTAYRIVQEALTNVVRHAPGARATVQVAVHADGIRIRVTDDGTSGQPVQSGQHGQHPHGQHGQHGQHPHGQHGDHGQHLHGQHGQGAEPAPTAGRHGITGMRERASAFGGTLSAAPLPGGGFEVAAFLPAPGHGTRRAA
ncbi:MAG TPA: histidine kinase [Trebonia sp.]|nr:histidine kinase [Trebonia sp.]